MINRFVDVPLRDEEHETPIETEDLSASLLPPLFLSVLPIALPVFLIAQGTIIKLWLKSMDQPSQYKMLAEVSEFLGEKNLALGIATVAALYLLRWAPVAATRKSVVNHALASGGVIILITAAGGAFGTMLRQAGVAVALEAIADTAPKFALLPFAFLVTAAIRTLQGSATVAMIIAAGVLQGLATPEQLGCHPVYLALAIGAGSKPIAWLTDSGFWIICKMSGMTEAEGLKTVSVLTVAMGISALAITMLGAWLFPCL